MAEIGKYLIEGLVKGINDTIGSVIKAFKDLWEKINEITAEVWEKIRGTVQTAWGKVKSIWDGFSRWFSANVTQPMAEYFGKLWDDIKNGASVVWDNLKMIWEVAASWFSDNVIDPMNNLFATLWNGVKNFVYSAWDGTKNVWNAASNWFNSTVVDPIKNAFGEALKAISGFFSSTWEGIKNIWGTVSSWFNEKIFGPLSNGFKSVFNNIIAFAEKFVNFFIKGINGIIGAFNKIQVDVPDWVPGIGGNKFGINIKTVPSITIPRLAKGGIVDSATIAMIGERGREAVLPLDSSEWKRELAQELAGQLAAIMPMQTGGSTIVIKAEGELEPLFRLFKFGIDTEADRAGPGFSKVVTI